MVTVEKAIIARLEKDGKHFEILVDPDLAYELKEGKPVSIPKMLAVGSVFSDSRKGLKPSENDLEKTFGTFDVGEITETIIKKGSLQLTTDFRRKKIEERKRQIASFISRHAINPQTRLPHPIERILAAMDQSKVSIDPFTSAQEQIEDVVKALKPIIPISIEELVLSVEIPAQYSGRAFGIIKELGSLQSQQWLTNGSLLVRLSIPAGLKDDVFRRLNSITEGNAKIEEVTK
jgi:ribosome maturation protein SDO1